MAAADKCVALIAVLFISFVVHSNHCQTILRHPSSQLVLPNDEATFICTVQTNGDFYVYINDRPVVPGDLTDVTIGPIVTVDESNVHTIPIVIVAVLNYNMTTVRCSLDQDGGDSSAVAYLWIAARPLPPNPSLTQINATTLYLSWMPPFTHLVAGVLNYTVKAFNTSSHQWKSWTVSASLPNTSSCHQADISGDFVHDCNHFHNNESVSRGLQVFFVTKALSDRNCDRLEFYVSASNVLGESEHFGVEGIFPIAPEWVLGTAALEMELYLQPDANQTLFLAIKHPPYICPRQRAAYYLLKNNGSERFLVCTDSQPTLIDTSRDMAVEGGDVLTLLIVTLAGNASISVTVSSATASRDYFYSSPTRSPSVSVTASRERSTSGHLESHNCSQTPIIATSALGVLTCCVALVCLLSTLMMYIWKSRGTVTPSVHQEQCNQFYDETERNIYDQIDVCKGTTFSYPVHVGAQK